MPRNTASSVLSTDRHRGKPRRGPPAQWASYTLQSPPTGHRRGIVEAAIAHTHPAGSGLRPGYALATPRLRATRGAAPSPPPSVALRGAAGACARGVPGARWPAAPPPRHAPPRQAVHQTAWLQRWLQPGSSGPASSPLAARRRGAATPFAARIAGGHAPPLSTSNQSCTFIILYITHSIKAQRVAITSESATK